MKMLALQCDNCGEYFSMMTDESKKKSDIDLANVIAFCERDYHGQSAIASYDICPTCRNRILESMPGIKCIIEFRERMGLCL